MSVNTERLRYLLSRNIAKQCTPDEMEELYDLVAAVDDEHLAALLDAIYKETKADAPAGEVNWEYMLADILRHPQVQKQQPHKKSGVIRRLMIAASVLVLLGMGAYYMITNRNKTKAPVSIAEQKDIPAPDGNRSTLILDDGTIVALDSLKDGVLAQDEDMRIVKLANGQIAYRTAGGKAITRLRYNTITNPRGSKVIDVLLSDGSRVWLNAGSSIKFPVAFINPERNVTLEGEGYFEVAKDPARRFTVSANGTRTEVLGTHFNVNAYADEPDTKVTLLQGSVKVAGNNSQPVTIRPGQQALVNAAKAVIHVEKADMDAVMAWKNGFFAFSDAPVKEVMQSLARWYDLTVVYEGKIPEQRFGGKIYRETPLSGVMKILGETGIAYEIKNGKVIIKSK